MHDLSQTDDWELLRAYVEAGSEAAFEELVHRYAGHVYAIALRRIGNPHLAQDVTQAVFLLLVRKAPKISKGTILLGWFSNAARFVSRTAIRGERRRSDRELAAMNDPSLTSQAPQGQWEEVAPEIDAAIESLNEKDRSVILLRFYQKKSVEDVSKAIGAGEAATQKRISRAVDKLKRFLSKRGITISSIALLGLLSESACPAASPQLVSLVIQSSLSKGACSTSPAVIALADSSFKAMAGKMAVKMALAMAASLAITGPVVGLFIHDKLTQTQTYSLSDDFSHSQNPNGVWAFGWSSSPDGAFRTIQYRKAVPVHKGVLIESWQLGPASNPAIYRNSGDQTWDSGQGFFPAGSVWFHAGENNKPQNFGVIRFTAPYGSSGTHRIKVSVSPHFHPSFAGDTDFYVVTNGVIAASKYLDTKATFDWTGSVKLRDGEAIDFCIGRGMDGDAYASGLKIQASIEAPMPSEERK